MKRQFGFSNSSTLFYTLLLCAVFVGSANAQKKGKGGKGGDGGGDPPPSTTLEYQLTLDLIPAVPNNYSGLNETGQFVGYLTDYAPGGLRAPFIYESLSGEITYINDILDQNTLPTGWSFAAALDVNDYGVVVGYAIDQNGFYHACAIDLDQPSPGLDILPTLVGSESTGLKINDDGVILGVERIDYGDGSSNWDQCWTIDTGLYGAPDNRISRQSSSLDLRSSIPQLVPTIADDGLGCDLSETSTAGVTWVAGVDSSGAPFRYALGDARVEVYSEFSNSNSAFGGVSIDGTIAGSAQVVTGRKGKRDITSRVVYRFDPQDASYENLTQDNVYTQDINNFNEVLLDGLSTSVRPAVFRDWGDGAGERLLGLDGLIRGSSADTTIWLNNDPRCLGMNDAGVIVGTVIDGATGLSYLFSMVPQSTSP